MAVVGRVIGCIATLTLWLNVQVCAFNLESRLPVIKQGAEGSYFGYSVAQHQILEEGSQKVIEQVLLIGAPRSATEVPPTNHSGAVYRCPVTTVKTDCSQLVAQQLEDDDRLIEDQWLGVTVKSQGPGKYVMTCAHRHVIKGPDYQWGQGICYSFHQFLDYDRVWEPCLNRPVAKAHEQFGYCQAGTSGEISEENNILIGSPGPYTWRGTIFSNSIRFDIRDDKTWHMGPLLDENSPVDKYSYLGMSVTSGRFFGNNISFVGGAPRSKGTGQVVFFQTQKEKKDSTFLVQLILDGEQFASSFGYTLASLDINSDGRRDLVVGAPFYYDKDKGGAIYVYMNSEKGFNNTTVPKKFTGKPESRFGFAISSTGDINRDGFEDLAVGAPYEDKGVVYIYLGSADGLHSEPSQVIRATEFPEDVLSRTNLSTFGYSLSGGVDMDSNGYPDLLIGAYESDTAMLLMSRPIINMRTRVRGNLTNIDPSKLGCEENSTADLLCFSFEACFKFNSSELSRGTSLTLRYRIEAETYTGKKYSRVTFGNSVNQSSPNIVEKDILVKEETLFEERCSKEIVYLKNKSDIQNPIKFKLTYNLVQKEPRMVREGRNVPDVNRYPVLNQVEASRVFEAKFLKDCGSNEICECDLHVEAKLNLTHKDGRPIFYLGTEHLTLTINVSNSKESAYDSTIYVTHSPSLTFGNGRAIRGDPVNCIPVTNIVVKCELSNPMKRGQVDVQIRFGTKKIKNDEKKLHLTIKVNTTSVEQTEEDDLELEADIVIKAELKLHGTTGDKEQVSYGGKIVGESAITYKDEIGNEVDHVYHVKNGGPGEVSYLDVVFYWPYQLANRGEPGKWILYLTETPTVKGNGYCNMEEGQVNPLNKKDNPLYKPPIRRPDDNLTRGEYRPNEASVRQRRKREIAKPEELRKEGKVERVVTLDCKMGTAQCIIFTCVIRDLKKDGNAVITIKSRLWNSTFVSDYPNVDSVSIVSRAEIQLDEDLGIQQENTNDDYASATSSAIPDIDLYQKAKGVPLWIIILAVCCGIILLVIVILCLWKFGFFKRKKPGYMPAETSDKEKEANNL